MILIIRYNFEISEDDYPYSLSQMLTLNLPIANARLVTLAPGLRPERRFAPLARGQLATLNYKYTIIATVLYTNKSYEIFKISLNQDLSTPCYDNKIYNRLI